MRSTNFKCDWCKAPQTQAGMHWLVVTPIDKIMPRELSSEICAACFSKLMDAIIAIAAHDHHATLGGGQS